MDLFHTLAEDRIKKAYAEGEFDNLLGYGRPLKLEDLSGIPEELRMAYKLLKNGGYTQEETDLRREFMTVEDLLKHCEDETDRANLQRRLNQTLLKYNQLMSKRRVKTNSAVFKNYELKIQEKLTNKDY
ncbi:DnaJ family domain-containing protein [Neobacillus sp. Marseille-QA0830]